MGDDVTQKIASAIDALMRAEEWCVDAREGMTRRLHSTTNAMVWAEEWCEVARGIEAADDGRCLIDEGWMVGWFANAMATADMHNTRVLYLEQQIQRALDELGVPHGGYPAPVANAVAHLRDTQKKNGVVA